MAITKAQQIALFQILEVPYDSTVYKLIDDNNMMTESLIVATASRRSFDLIQQRLTTIASDTDLEAVLSGLLDRWIELGTKTTTVVDGRVGGVDGIDYDPNRERLEIRAQVIVIVPFYRHHESMERDNAGINSIPMCRK